MHALPPESIALYVHLPWCVRKCPYCDFNSHELQGSLRETEYIDCLLKDLETEAAQTDATIKTVYFGGGTPSLFSPNSFERLLSHPLLNTVEEVTMEANPGAVEYQSLTDYQTAGITRLSLGVQSLHDDSLKRLGRIHNAQEARAAIEAALYAGFKSVNLDMMYGLPNQSMEDAIDDLEQLLAYGSEHISWYELTIEPNTVFAKFPPHRASEIRREEMSIQGLLLLSKFGYIGYEVSAFTQSFQETACRHNLNYWRFGDYLGIGAGAHGKITGSDGKVTRTRKSKPPVSYMKQPNSHKQEISNEDLPVEFMMNVLRLRNGVQESYFEKRTGLKLKTVNEPLTRCREEGLIERNRIALTDRGWHLLNSVVERFL